MPKRSSRKLAGCIVIELALAAAGVPSGSAADYRAGAAESGSARALVLEDARRHRAVFTQTEFRITGAVADFVAARLLVSLDLERPGLLFHWSGIGARPEQPGDLVAAITAAVAALEPAEVRYGHRSLFVAAGERCLGTLSPDGGLAFGGCADGAAVTGAIRAAFQMVEPVHGLQKRGERVRSFPVQAIALGKQVTVLALSGEAALPEGINPRGLIFAPFSNEAAPPPQDARVRDAIERVLARVK
jgi:hypothetical protein